MSNNETLNASIRAKLVEANKIYGFLTQAGIDACWDDHSMRIRGISPTTKIDASGTEIHNLWLEMYRSLPYTPDELCYIHENLAPEAWAKLGLKLPEPLVSRFVKAAYKANTSLPEKKLEYTIPRDLPPSKVAWLKASVEKGKCQPYNNFWSDKNKREWVCQDVCGTWVEQWNRAKCGGVHSTRPEYLEMFKTILDAQLPPLKYNVAELNAKEREVVEHAAKSTTACCNSAGQQFTCFDCVKTTYKIFQRNQDGCIFESIGNSPLRAQIIDALKRVLEQQELLLPPHNVVQFEKYPIWILDDLLKGHNRKYIITHENGNKLLFEGGWVMKAQEGSVYTKTPPAPKEKFEPYVAVYSGGLTLELRLVIAHDNAEAKTTYTLGGTQQWYPLTDVESLSTNPRECRDMCNEVLGEKDMVEEIKAYCEEWLKPIPTDTADPEFREGVHRGYTNILSLIKRESKCKS